jgi:hypothetical protein
MIRKSGNRFSEKDHAQGLEASNGRTISSRTFAMGGNDAAGRGDTAARAVICTNGYSGNLVPTLRTTVIAPTPRG